MHQEGVHEVHKAEIAEVKCVAARAEVQIRRFLAQDGSQWRRSRLPYEPGGAK